MAKQAKAERYWMIEGPFDTHDDCQLYWSNMMGWVSEEIADLYTDAEKADNPILPLESKRWELA